MRITAYAVIARKHKIVGKGKKEREILGKEHIVYDQAPGGGGCDCSYVEDMYWIFKTKKEAAQHIKYPPYPYMVPHMSVKKVIINICK